MIPPPVQLDRRLAVPVDIERVEARLTFDVAAKAAMAEVAVEFVVAAFDGCPVLDLRQQIGSARLDDAPLDVASFSHQDLGGGTEAEMLVLDRELVAGSRHRLELGYPLATPAATGAMPIEWGDDGVSFDLWMSDLHPGRYLEMWLPANLCHDRFALGIDLMVVGGSEHTVLTNGSERPGGPGQWRLDYPPQFTSLSPMLVLAPALQVESRRRPVTVADRPLELVTARVGVGADLAGCEADVAAWLVHNGERYGPWAHGPRFTAVVFAAERGMEYDGATTAAVGALEHEVFHSWFGRGIKPASARDGWIDEAWTSWATTSRRAEEGRYAAVDQGLDESPVLLYPPGPWSRYTPKESYREGARLFAGLAHRLGGAPSLRHAMAAWYQANAGGFVDTDGLERHLSDWSGQDVGPWFRRYVHGRA